MKEKLNICLMNDSFPPVIDGVANVVKNYADNLYKMGAKVVVATPDYPGIKDDNGYEILKYPSIDTVDKIGYVTGIPFELNYLSQFVDKDIDILHTHCPMTSNYLARVLRDTLHKPIVFTYHTKYDIDIQRAIKGKLIQEAAVKAIVENISACDEVWAVSKGAADNLKSLGYKGEVIIMENGTDMPKGIPNSEDVETIRKEFNLDKTIPTFLFVGRMMWYKGIKIILDGLKLYQENGNKFKMLFVGSGLELEGIKEYTSKLNMDDCISFVGPIKDRNKLKTIFGACDLFLFPSTFDTNGLVVREAASSGLGSVLVKGSCAAEGTRNDINCFHIEENAESLYNVLKSHNMDDYKRIGINAMNDLYRSWEDATKEAYERYEKLLENYEYKQTKSISENFFHNISIMSKLLKESRNNVEEVLDNIYEDIEIIHDLRNEIKSDIKEDISNFKKHAKESFDNLKK